MRLFVLLLAALPPLRGIAAEPALTLDTIRRQVVPAHTVAGHFVQCSISSRSTIRSDGEYRFDPGRSLVLDFASPLKQTITLFHDGSRTRSVAGVEQKSADHSPVNSLVMALLDLQVDRLNELFEVSVDGTLDEFQVRLDPRARLEKQVRGISLRGNPAGIQSIDLRFPRDRAVIIQLMAKEAVDEFVCP